MFSYIESHGGKFDKTVFFGLQYMIERYFSGSIITTEIVDQAKQFWEHHGMPFNYEGWMRVVNVHKGKLPVRIRAVPEGSVIPTHNILVSIESTDPECFWIASWLETQLVRLWYSTNVATISYYARKLITKFLVETSDTNPNEEVLFKLHDFGGRGASTRESATIGGAAHLINFRGSDTGVGVALANEMFNCQMSGFSIPASEHSTITSWGKNREADAYRNMLEVYGGKGKVLACVSDSYDIYNACENIWGSELKQQVINSGATLVIRPDSGDPESIVLGILKILGRKFGYTVNSKGFYVLNYVKVIQEDGVNLEDIEKILSAIKKNNWSAENVSFGMGGGLLQVHNRDTQRFAMKCCWVIADGKEIDVFKEPATDKIKNSKRGRLDLIITNNNEYKTVKLNSGQDTHPNSIMKDVFLNGNILIKYTFDEIRENAWPTK
jgi:nicotinamide phosphoribosyltransferase